MFSQFFTFITYLKPFFMANKQSTLTYRWMEEVWNKGREEAIDEMLGARAVVHGIEEIKGEGPGAFKQFFHSFRNQFPQVHVEVDDVVTEGDFETARCSVRAVTAAGQAVSFGGMTFTRITDGKITEAWNNFDFLEMYRQLGFKMGAPQEMTA
jgi:predicted ester cyclase